MTTGKGILIGLVGPCASGKSTLKMGLEKQGYRVRHIAQEHSHVADMWKRISNPDILIFLDVTFLETLKRRELDWNEADFNEQQRRLADARQNADLIIQTDRLSIEQVLEKAVAFIAQVG